MAYEIKSYTPEIIEKQVDLIWEVTDNWKYPYSTSYESLKQTYSAESFDGSTRFYAMQGDDLIGFITAAITKDEEKGDYGTLRFPIVKNSDEEISTELINKVENRFKEMGIDMVRAPAGVGMGNTLDLAKKYGYEEKSQIFIRSVIPIEDLKLSGNTDQVVEYNDDKYQEKVKTIFTHKLGMSEKQGVGFHQWVSANRERKEKIELGRTDWRIVENDGKVVGFSYLHRSDHNPIKGELAPVWFDDSVDGKLITDGIISAHVKALGPLGMKTVSTYLGPKKYDLEQMYNEFGFSFDATYSYTKQL